MPHLADWVVIADGEPLTRERLFALVLDKKVMVLDGAYEHVINSGIRIDILLGDFDSIRPEILAQARSMTQVVYTPDQNYTDLEKGILHLDQLNARSICIGAATGLRLQHSFYNLCSLKKFYNLERPITLCTATELVSYHKNTQIIVTGEINDGIAFFGFPTAKVTTLGLKYNVKNYEVEFAKFASVSNALAANTATITMDGEILIIQETSR